ncbi:methyltransferase [Cytophagaceae bacterium ABcell3]|nr:methyltransferase [Cytophagaceae bacterium ABcell3]
MANNYFKFKQFTIYQDQCGMKVCTDSCVFGALIKPEGAKRILDIGTGTGLLALMVAQRAIGHIDAIEKDESAYKQALFNINHSPWPEQVSVYHQALQDYRPRDGYDLICCNPPFYKDYLKSGKAKYDLACHSAGLSPSVLLQFADKYLKYDGRFYILYPEKEFASFEQEAERYQLSCQEKILIRNHYGKPAIRVVGVFSKITKPNALVSELVIRNSDQSYTSAFNDLLKSYYYNL